MARPLLINWRARAAWQGIKRCPLALKTGMYNIDSYLSFSPVWGLVAPRRWPSERTQAGAAPATSCELPRSDGSDTRASPGLARARVTMGLAPTHKPPPYRGRSLTTCSLLLGPGERTKHAGDRSW